jgi:anti-sigma B factor antagonist
MNEFLETTETGDAVIAMLLEEQLIDEILVQKVASQIHELLQDGGPQHLILDLSRVWIVCSSMLSKLITLNKKVQSAGGTLRLCGVSPRLYEVFAITKLNKLFAIYDSRQQALESVCTSANA